MLRPTTLRPEARTVYHRWMIYSAIYLLSTLPLLQRALAVAPDASSQTVFIIPHTHWEGAVFKTREEYLQEGLPRILKVLYLLKKYPDYRFVLDQMCYVRPFLERYPSEVPALREFLAQGRLEIAGGTDTMNDNNMPSGESIARQYLLAKTFFRERLGYEVTTGWALDTFGHNAQMPQILRLAGMKSYWFMRGAASADMPSEFLWEGIDSSRIPAFWLPLSYNGFGAVPGTAPEFARLLHYQFGRLGHFGSHPERVLLAGGDVSEPSEALPTLVDAFNSSSVNLSAKLATPGDFATVVAQRNSPEIFRGELNPVGQGIYSNRIELKQMLREAESLLTTAEELGVMAASLDSASDPEMLERAWEPVLFNEEHDPAAGSVVDKVYADEVEDYAHARRLAQASVARDFASIARDIDTSGQGVPVVVLNTLGWRRTDVAEVDIPFTDPGIHEFVLLDSEGRQVPTQVLRIERNGDGGIRLAHIAFVARDVPSVGYTVYHAVPKAAVQVSDSASQDTGDIDDHLFRTDSAYQDSGNIENDLYRISFDLRTGAMTSLVLKADNWQVLRAPGNVVAREEDRGEPWELYGNYAGDVVSTKKPVPLPRAAYTQWSNDFGGSGKTTSGPVFSQYETPRRPFGQNFFATRVRIYNGLRRIDIHTELVNEEKLVRYRALFPTTLANGTAVDEIPFGAIERPQQEEFPAQNWVDFSDGHKGLALLNRGIPGNNVANGALMLSLMRSANLDAYPFFGGNEPGVSSDTGLGVGRRYVLDYALLPHSGDWRSAEPWRDGLEFNNPLLVRTVSAHRGELPARWGFLDVSHRNVVLSALKSAKTGSTVVRVYEAAGKATTHVSVTLHRDIEAVHAANLIEDEGKPLGTNTNVIDFDLRPFEIKTLVVKLKRPSRPNRH